jgi:hypothetical protein
MTSGWSIRAMIRIAPHTEDTAEVRHVDLLDKLGSALFEGARDLFFESRTGGHGSVGYHH